MNASEFARRRARIEHSGRGGGYAARAMRGLVRDARAAIIISRGKAVGWRMPNGQVVCRKRRYASGAEADLELARIQREGVGHIPVRAYPCPHCNGWHLTSQASGAA